MSARLLGALGSWWFANAPAQRPAVARILVGGYALWYLRGRTKMLRSMAETDPKLFRPVGVARLIDKPVAPEVISLTVAATLAANVAFVAGWRHRISGRSSPGSCCGPSATATPGRWCSTPTTSWSSTP